jgi:ATP phosphoribosyltransferase regulatory subunit HisZ
VSSPDRSLPLLAAHARLSHVEDTLLATLRAAGFTRVHVPTFAPLDGYADRLGDEVRTEYVTFVLGGEQVLRPEFTTSVCQLVLGDEALRATPGPLRLAYAGQTFRAGARAVRAEPGSFPHEFPHERRQVGGELIGAPAPEGDAELVRLLAALVTALGGRGWTLSLGHAALLERALSARGADPAQAARIRRDLHRLRRHAERLASGDALLTETLPRLLAARAGRAGLGVAEGGALALPAWERQVVRAEWERAGIPDGAMALLDDLARVRGDQETVASWLRATVGRAVDEPLAELAVVVERCAELARPDDPAAPLRLVVDAAASRDLSYYTGALFELHGPQGGPPLAVGGRYDRFFEAVGGPGAARPAIGVALDPARIARALDGG